MNCVFLRPQFAVALTFAGVASASLSAQPVPSTSEDLGSQVALSDFVPPPRFPIVRDGKWGLIDVRGAELVPPRYDDVAACAGSSGRPMVHRNAPQAVRDGVLLKDCAPLRQDLISVSVGGNWGAIDVDGREVIAPTLDGIRIWNRFVAAREGDKWGIMDRTGRYTIPPRFEAVTPVSDLAAVRVDGKWGLIGAEGEFSLTPQLDQAPLLFSGDELVLAKREDRWGLLHTGGTWAVEPKFDRIYRFVNGLGNATLGGKMGYIDSTGAWVIKPRYEVTAPFGPEGPALVTIDDEQKYMDRAGNVVIEGAFYIAHSFDGKLARAAIGTSGDDITWGYLGTDGTWVLTPVYDDVSEFQEGLAAVTKDGRTSYIDQEGRVVLQLDCEGVSFSEGLAAIIVDDNWGYIDRNGVRVIEPRFDRGYEFEYGLAKVLVGDSIIYIDREGIEVFVMEFPGLGGNVRTR